MKKNFKILLCNLLFILTSCSNNFLDKKPSHGMDIEVLSNEQGIESLLIGAYSGLHLQAFDSYENPSLWGPSPTGWIYGDIYGDDAYKGSDAGDQVELLKIESYQSQTDNSYYALEWEAVYQGVARCNYVLQAVESALQKQSIKENQTVQYRAEAKFLRAYYHLEAIKLWDFIPFVDEKNLTGIVPNKVSSSAEDDGANAWINLSKNGYIPWAEVEADLDSASKNLPITPRNGQAGRVTKYAAMGLWARARMFQGKYSTALILLNEIIESGHYSLATNFHDNFRTGGDNNGESLFDIQASVNDGSHTILFDGAYDAGTVNGNLGDLLNFPMGGSTVPAPGGCCGFYQPSQNLVNAYKTQNGLPYLESFGLNFNKVGEDVKNDEGYASTDTTFTTDTRPLDPRLDWTVGRRGIPYLDWGPHPGKYWIRDQDYMGPYSPKKNVYYKSEEGETTANIDWGGNMNTAKNYHLIRYADILLMAAECEVEGGNFGEARKLVNMVRARAKNGSWVLENGAEDYGTHTGPSGELPAANYEVELYPTGGALDPFQNQSSAREAVRFERRLEFGMEGMRFWDLKRWGVTKDVLNKYIEKESKLRSFLQGVVFEDKRVRHPIPRIALERSKDYNTGKLTLQQNPGY